MTVQGDMMDFYFMLSYSPDFLSLYLFPYCYHGRKPSWKNPGRFAPDPVRPLDVSPQRRFAPGRFAPGCFAPLVVSPLVDSPQEEISTYFVEIYVNS